MSCDRYNFATWINSSTEDRGGCWDECSVSFADDGATECLCTLGAHSEGIRLDGDQVRSLAYLGLAVVLAHHGGLPDGGCLPACLPEGLRSEIERIVAVEPNEEWLESRTYTEEQVAMGAELVVQIARLRRRADFEAEEGLRAATDSLTLEDLRRDSVPVDDIEEAVK